MEKLRDIAVMNLHNYRTFLRIGMQIDLLIDRQDDVVNACEMKFTRIPYIVTKAYELLLEQRKAALEQLFPNKSVHLTLVTTFPMESNAHRDVFQSEVTLDDLFA